MHPHTNTYTTPLLQPKTTLGPSHMPLPHSTSFTTYPSGNVKKTEPREGVVGNFVKKLFDIVENEADDVICWIRDGSAFHIKSTKALSEKVLPKYFRHGKFSSLIRQLNFYSFYKVPSTQDVIYHHSFFRKGRPDLLVNIKRRGTGKPKDALVNLDTLPLSTSERDLPQESPSPKKMEFPCASPMSKPVTLDSMSPLHKPGVPLVLPPSVDLGTMLGAKRKSDANSKEVKRCRIEAEPEMDISVFFNDKSDSESVEFLSSSLSSASEQPEPRLLSRDCLKYPIDEEETALDSKCKDTELLQVAELVSDGDEEWGRPLSPLNLPENSTWLDLAF